MEVTKLGVEVENVSTVSGLVTVTFTAGTTLTRVTAHTQIVPVAWSNVGSPVNASMKDLYVAVNITVKIGGMKGTALS